MKGKRLFILFVTVMAAVQPHRPDLLPALDAYVSWSEQVSSEFLNTIVDSSTLRRFEELGSSFLDHLRAAIEQKKTELGIEIEEEDMEKNVLTILESGLTKSIGTDKLLGLLIGTSQLDNHGARLAIATTLFTRIGRQMRALVDLLETDPDSINEQKLRKMVELTTAAETLFDTMVANFKSVEELVAVRPGASVADAAETAETGTGAPDEPGEVVEVPLSRENDAPSIPGISTTVPSLP